MIHFVVLEILKQAERFIFHFFTFVLYCGGRVAYMFVAGMQHKVQ